jgi:hypothetical protein
MLHFGHLPGALCTTSGWCGQVYWVAVESVLAFLQPEMNEAEPANVNAARRTMSKRFMMSAIIGCGSDCHPKWDL